MYGGAASAVGTDLFFMLMMRGGHIYEMSDSMQPVCIQHLASTLHTRCGREAG